MNNGAGGTRAGVTPNVKLLPDEMIADREVARTEDDRLQHSQIGQQLADLVVSVPMPSNIALYGAWGSGKSGIGNLVRCHLEVTKRIGKNGDFAFARFDAFKYAENPLRRNFVSAVARELRIEDDAFHSDLYSGKTKTELEFPLRQTFRLVGIFLSFLGFVACLLLAASALVAWLQTGDTSDNFGDIGQLIFKSALAPAALLAAFVALGGKTLHVDRKTDKADSDEQFEELFKDLVSKIGRKVVVFVDELDRCSAQNVVATLDALRTFLGVPNCVFVVAADRQALEEALSSAMQQATPSDTVNPYYSEGSAYLDKVFQYEVTVPPLLRHSVTRFAVELVRDKPGVWADLRDLELVVSILVPSHVRSPRRVKGLLNAFALAYRLAEAREQSGLLRTDVRGRAPEIARLACLRIEFPLFAQHLVVDHRLPVYVLALDTAGTLEESEEQSFWNSYPFATAEVRDVARRFAELQEPVATFVDDAENEERPDADGPPDAVKASPVARKAGRQLLDYLSRTRDVPGPGRDLIHLRSTGSVVGLDSDVAESIEDMASNGSIPQIMELVERLDGVSRQAVLELLVEHARGALGVEAQGVAKTLLALAGHSTLDLTQHGAAIANALAPTLEQHPQILDDSALPGAWRLGTAASTAMGRRLQKVVLESAATTGGHAVGLIVLRDARSAIAADAALTQLVLRAQLSGAQSDLTAEAIAGLTPDDAVALLNGDPQGLASALSEVLAALTPVTPGAAAAAAPATAAAAAAAEAEAAEAAEATALASKVLEALGTLLHALAPGSHGPAQTLLGVLLLVDRQPLRDLIEPPHDLRRHLRNPAAGHRPGHFRPAHRVIVIPALA